MNGAYTQTDRSTELMTKHHRPTGEKLFQRCPGALDHYEQGTPEDFARFDAGNAAHEFAYAWGTGLDVQALARDLVTVGKAGPDSDGKPLDPDKVTEGRYLFERWEARHGPPPDGCRFEERFAFDDAWNRLEWTADVHPDSAHIYTRLDRCWHTEVEGPDGEVLNAVATLDFKTSWAAKASQLHTIQRRRQMLVVWKAYKPAAIVLQIGALRSMQLHERVVFTFTDEGKEELERAEREWAEYVEASAVRPRRYNPGPACMGCPYTMHCGAIRAFLRRPTTETPREDVARIYAAAKALQTEAAKWMKHATADGDLEVDGFRVTRKPMTKWRVRVGGTQEALRKVLLMYTGIDERLAEALRASFSRVKRGQESIRLLKAFSEVVYTDRSLQHLRDEWVEQFLDPYEEGRLRIERISDEPLDCEDTNAAPEVAEDEIALRQTGQIVRIEDWLPELPDLPGGFYDG